MSLLRETLESGKFAVTTEMAPPKGKGCWIRASITNDW